jgi:hypothetical protein
MSVNGSYERSNKNNWKFDTNINQLVFINFIYYCKLKLLIVKLFE